MEPTLGKEPSGWAIILTLWIVIHCFCILVAALMRDKTYEDKREARIRLAAMVFGPGVLLVLLGMEIGSIYRNAFPKKDPSLPRAKTIKR